MILQLYLSVLRDLSQSLSCEIRRPSSTNKKVETLSGFSGHLACCSNKCRIETRQRAERTGEKVDPCSTPTLAGKREEKKWFQLQVVTLFVRQFLKNTTTSLSKSANLIMLVMILWFKDGKNQAMSNAMTLVLSHFVHSALIVQVRNNPLLVVDL